METAAVWPLHQNDDWSDLQTPTSTQTTQIAYVEGSVIDPKATKSAAYAYHSKIAHPAEPLPPTWAAPVVRDVAPVPPAPNPVAFVPATLAAAPLSTVMFRAGPKPSAAAPPILKLKAVPKIMLSPPPPFMLRSPLVAVPPAPDAPPEVSGPAGEPGVVPPMPPPAVSVEITWVRETSVVSPPLLPLFAPAAPPLPAPPTVRASVLPAVSPLRYLMQAAPPPPEPPTLVFVVGVAVPAPPPPPPINVTLSLVAFVGIVTVWVFVCS